MSTVSIGQPIEYRDLIAMWRDHAFTHHYISGSPKTFADHRRYLNDSGIYCTCCSWKARIMFEEAKDTTYILIEG